jgi:methionine sulfoxide reductase heme-binding subunit
VENGQSPPPFTEKVATYRVKLDGRDILLDPEALAPGTPVEPAVFAAENSHV